MCSSSRRRSLMSTTSTGRRSSNPRPPRPLSKKRSERIEMKAFYAFVLPIVGLSLLTPALSGCRKLEAAVDKPPTLVSVQSVQSQSTGEGALRYSGSIQPYTRVSLAFKVGGYVQEIEQRPDVNGRLRLLQ